MKIRQGFVSNSSSSSFVLYGHEIEEDYSDEVQAQFHKLGLRLLSGGEDGVGDSTVLGTMIAETDDDYLESAELDMNELTNSIKDITKLYEEGKINIKNHSPKLYVGTRMC